MYLAGTTDMEWIGAMALCVRIMPIEWNVAIVDGVGSYVCTRLHINVYMLMSALYT